MTLVTDQHSKFLETFSSESMIRITRYMFKEQGIYILFKCCRVVYVGQTRFQGLARPLAGHKDKEFDEICYWPINVHKSDLSEIENILIATYKPKYNKVCPKAGMSLREAYAEISDILGRYEEKEINFNLYQKSDSQISHDLFIDGNIDDAFEKLRSIAREEGRGDIRDVQRNILTKCMRSILDVFLDEDDTLLHSKRWKDGEISYFANKLITKMFPDC